MEQQLTPQRSEQWFRLRLGKFTSGHAYIFMPNSKTAGEPNAGAKTFITQKLWELVCGHHKEIKAWQLEHGNQWEPYAKKMVQDKYKSEYFDCEMVQNTILPYHCGSPDGIIEINGMDMTAETKCPVGEEHLNNIRIFKGGAERVKKDYPELYWQCQSNMYLQNTKMAIAVSFQPEAEALMYADIMLPRNDEDIALMISKMAEGWEWMNKEAAEYGIDILAKYEDFKKPVGLQPITDEQAFNHNQAA
jgi:hypothetical protein